MKNNLTLTEVERIMNEIQTENKADNLSFVTGESGKDNFIKTSLENGLPLDFILAMITPYKNGLYLISTEIK